MRLSAVAAASAASRAVALAANAQPASAATAATSIGASGSVASTTSAAPGGTRGQRAARLDGGQRAGEAAGVERRVHTIGASMIAVILASGRLERLYTGLSLLVSAAAEGEPARGLATFAALAPLLDERLEARALRPDETPALTEPGRATFARTLAELRDTARGAAGVPHLGLRGRGRDDRRRARGRRGAARRRAVDAALPARGRRRAAGGRVRRAALGGRCRRRCSPAAASPPADLFAVERSGADRNANVRLLVSDGGSVTLQRRASTRSTPTRLLTARAARARPRAAGRAGHRAAARPRHAALLPRLDGGRARSRSRTARPGVPRTFHRLAAFTKDVTERVLRDRAR